MGALFDFKCTCDSTLVYVCQADAKLHPFVDYFVTDSPAHSPGNVRRGSDFSPDFLSVPQRTENAEKTRLSR